MSRVLPLHLSLLAIVIIGCGQPTVAPEDAYEPESVQGTVDTTLPPNLRKKQEAVCVVLDAVYRGISPDMIQEEDPGIQFRETNDSFYGGAIGLAGWDFDGKPTGNDVPVVLHLAEDSAGEKTRTQQRVYAVTNVQGRVVITRK